MTKAKNVHEYIARHRAAIAANPSFSSIPLLVLTSTGQRGEAAEFSDLGAAAYLTKPLEQGEMMEAIRAATAFAESGNRGDLVTRHWLESEVDKIRREL